MYSVIGCLSLLNALNYFHLGKFALRSFYPVKTISCFGKFVYYIRTIFCRIEVFTECWGTCEDIKIYVGTYVSVLIKSKSFFSKSVLLPSKYSLKWITLHDLFLSAFITACLVFTHAVFYSTQWRGIQTLLSFLN